MARMLFMARLQLGILAGATGCIWRRRRIFGGKRQEDLLEAYSHWSQFQQSPAVANDRRGNVATDVASLFAAHFEGHVPGPRRRLVDVGHSCQVGEDPLRVAAR